MEIAAQTRSQIFRQIAQKFRNKFACYTYFRLEMFKKAGAKPIVQWFCARFFAIISDENFKGRIV